MGERSAKDTGEVPLDQVRPSAHGFPYSRSKRWSRGSHGRISIQHFLAFCYGSAPAPITGVKMVAAKAIWGEGGWQAIHSGLPAEEPGFEWIAVLLEPSNQRALRDLSAPPYSTAKSTPSRRASSTRMASSSGLAAYFYPEVEFGEYLCRMTCITRRGYHEMLSCQQCIDVAAAVNVLIRTDTIIQVVDRFGVMDADDNRSQLGWTLRNAAN